MNVSSWGWVRRHKWKLLLIGIALLLVISPISEKVYDEQDNIITPLTAAICLAVIFGAAEKKRTIWLLSILTMIWLVISEGTEGSGLFTGVSILAPLLFMVLLVAIFILLARWLIRAVHVNTEVLCAAICGYLLLGVWWTGLYAIVRALTLHLHPNDPSPFISSTASQLTLSDLLYFSYTTLTTTGFGDIVPRTPTVRMLAVLEAIVGLFYNTIVIARFVGLYGIKLQNPEADSTRQEMPPK